MLTVLYVYCILLTVPSIFTFFKCLLLFFLNNVLVSYPTKRKRAYRLHSLLYHIICRDCNYSLYCIICFTKCIFFFNPLLENSKAKSRTGFLFIFIFWTKSKQLQSYIQRLQSRASHHQYQNMSFSYFPTFIHVSVTKITKF